MTIKDLQTLLKKALTYNLLFNVNTILGEKNISNSNISNGTGRAGNWFNDAKNNNEDIRFSTVARVFAAIKPETKTEIATERDPEIVTMLSNVFSEKVFELANVLNNLTHAEGMPIHVLIQSDRKFYQNLIAEWASIQSLGKLTTQEMAHVNQISEWLN